MLNLTPKVSQAIQQSSSRPVIYTEIVTQFTDRLISLYNDWQDNTLTTAGSGTVSTTGTSATFSVAHGLVIGDYIKLTSGAQSGEIRRIIAVPLTTTATLDSAFSANQTNQSWAKLQQTRTQIQKEDPSATNPFSALQMLYPAQSGDPIQTSLGFDLSRQSGDMPEVYIDYRGYRQATGVQANFPFQTFRVNIGEQLSYPVSTIKLKLKKSSNTPNGVNIYLFVFESPPGVQALDNLAFARFGTIWNTYQSNAVLTNSLSTSYQEITFTFTTAINCIKDKQYFIFPILIGSGVFDALLTWETYRNRNIKPGEASGNSKFDTNVGYILETIDEQELFLKVMIPAYSYDGSTANYGKMKHDLGETPTINGYFDFDYETIKDSRVRFRAWGSATGTFTGEETDIGATDSHKLSIDGHDGSVTHVHDGDEISNLKRYYAIECNLLGINNPPLWAATTAKSIGNIIRPTVSGGNGFVYECTIAGTTGSSEPTWPLVEGQTVTDNTVTWKAISFSLLYTPSVRKLNVVFPKRIHRFSSAPLNIDGCLPFIKDIPSIPSKLDLKGYLAQTQSGRLNLVDLEGYGSLPALEENLKNATIEQRIGMNPESIDNKNDMAPYASGKVTDYSYELGLMSIAWQDRSKDFSIKLPRSRITANDKPPSLDYVGMHLVDVLEDIIVNRIRIPRRYIDLPSFRTVRDVRLGDKWKSMRIIPGDKPEEAQTLVKEILQVIGCFLVAGEDGKLRLVQYPRSENAVITWDNNDLIPGTQQADSFDSSIINQCVLKYNHDGDDYGSYVVYVDGTAQSDWAPGAGIFVADRTIESKWIGSDNYFGGVLASTITARIVRHAKDGIITTKCKTSLKHLAIQVGDYINLKTPVFLRKGTRGSLKSAQKFMVASKNINYGSGSIDWELIESRDFNRAPIPAFSMDVTSGTPSFTVNVNGASSSGIGPGGYIGISTDPDGDSISTYEWDWDYDGVNFQKDDTGSSQSHQYVAANVGRKLIALRVTDAQGLSSIFAREIRILEAPTAVISLVSVSFG